EGTGSGRDKAVRDQPRSTLGGVADFAYLASLALVSTTIAIAPQSQLTRLRSSPIQFTVL
ncbi:MAG: hypothetical protein ACPGPS_05915, partial [Rubripirellula sp.]